MKRYLKIIEASETEEVIEIVNDIVDTDNIKIINYEILPNTSKTKILLFYEKLNNNDIDF